MIRSIYGPITNTKTGKSKDIVVSVFSKKNIKDILIGGCITMVGITYLTLSTFKNGANEFEKAEFKTLKELDLIS